MQLELALSLPRDHRSVPVARHVVRAGMLIMGVDADCTHDVEVALSEACTNVLQHRNPAAEYQVRLRLDDRRAGVVGRRRAQGDWARRRTLHRPAQAPRGRPRPARQRWPGFHASGQSGTIALRSEAREYCAALRRLR